MGLSIVVVLCRVLKTRRNEDIYPGLSIVLIIVFCVLETRKNEDTYLGLSIVLIILFCVLKTRKSEHTYPGFSIVLVTLEFARYFRNTRVLHRFTNFLLENAYRS